MIDSPRDTIAAASTAPGRSALAIVRLTGTEAVAIGDRVFRGRTRLAEAASHSLHLGHVVGASGEPLDEVVAGVYRAPRSYTGEDVVEITCHGSPVLVEAILDLLRASGARPAAPGEFTKRAFLSGKIDLAQAEAVAALIHARTRDAARAALRQLGGALSAEIRSIRSELLSELAILEAHIDFPDEDLPGPERERAGRRAAEIADRLRHLAERARRSRPAARTVTVVLTGIPNVGKSSLFNALLGSARAIVHDEPGTTRDVIDAEISVGPLSVRLLDTAGLSEGSGVVEAEGVARSRAEIERGDRIVLVVDGTSAVPSPREAALLASLDPERTILVLNKCDLGSGPAALGGWSGETLRVSARTGEGIPALERWIERSVMGGSLDAGELLLLGRRQEDALERAKSAAENAFRLLTSRAEASELVAEEWRAGVKALGEITGETFATDLLDTIFSSFCIGK